MSKKQNKKKRRLEERNRRLTVSDFIHGAFILAALAFFLFNVSSFSFIGDRLFLASIETNLKFGNVNKEIAIDEIYVEEKGGDFTSENNNVSRVDEIHKKEVLAKSFLSVEFSSGAKRILLEKNPDLKLPVASLVKLMTALLVLEEYPMDYLVAVSEKAMEQDGNQGSLRPGEVFSAKDLLYMILLESSNRAAYALSEVIGNELFVVKMNRKAMELGLRNTYFEDVTGLSPNSYSSAEDVALLSKHLFSTYPLFKDIIGAREMNFYLPDGTFHHRGVNTNQLLGVNSIIGGKTGWTNAARGCLMVIQQNVGSDAYTIYVVLGAEDRFWEMRKLMHNVTRNAFAI